MEERARSQPKLTQHKTKQKGGCERTDQKLPLLHSWPGGVHQIPVAHSHNRKTWRRERDSNPRYPFGYTSFPGVHLKPLGHLSRYEKIPAGWRRHSLRAAQSINGMSEAEREGFEPPVPLRVHLISNQTQSTSSAISPILANIGQYRPYMSHRSGK